MAFESVRSYVQLASGLGEMTKARALEAAQGLLSLPGADEVTRRAVQASTLADQLLEAAKANRDNLVALVQGEVESALQRADVVRPADLEAARASVAALAHELADLRATILAAGLSAVGSASRSPLGVRGRAATGAVSTRVGHVADEAADRWGLVDSPAPTTSTSAAPAPTTPTRKSAAKKSAAKKSAGKKTVAKSAAPTSAARKSVAKSAGSGAAAKKSVAKSAASKSTARKSATKPAAKRATAKKATAATSAATKSAAKRATAKQSTSTAKKASS